MSPPDMAPARDRTLYRKLVDAHTVRVLDDDHVLLYCDLHLMNEYTSPQAFAGLEARGRGVAAPGQNMAVVSHVIPTEPTWPRVIAEPASALQAGRLRRNCERHGIALFGPDHPLQGIEHVVAPELGMIRPGMVVLCGDSHTTTYGALGALGFGIGTSEVEQVLATQTLAYRKARDMRVTVHGRLPRGTTAKDLLLHLLATIGAQGARGFVVEFRGTAIDALSVESRFTLCNMAVEAGARGALIAPDEAAANYVLERAADLQGAWREAALAQWRELASDPQARFDVELDLDAARVAPYVTWGTSPDQAIPVDARIPGPESAADAREAANTRRALAYTRLGAGQAVEGLEISHVFIGSCTNARIEDLREVARIVGDARVADGVRAMVVPGSGRVRDAAEAEGIGPRLRAAGFEWRAPGCSMCLGMNGDVLQPGQRCAATTNRNFEGRQRRGAITHVMSPAMAAAAAVAGRIVDVRAWETQA